MASPEASPFSCVYGSESVVTEPLAPFERCPRRTLCRAAGERVGAARTGPERRPLLAEPSTAAAAAAVPPAPTICSAFSGAATVPPAPTICSAFSGTHKSPVSEYVSWVQTSYVDGAHTELKERRRAINQKKAEQISASSSVLRTDASIATCAVCVVACSLRTSQRGIVSIYSSSLTVSTDPAPAQNSQTSPTSQTS